MKRRLLIALLFVPLVLVIIAGVAHAAGISGKPVNIGAPAVQEAYPPPDDPLPTEANYPAPMTPEPTWMPQTPESEYPPHIYDENGNLIWCSHIEPWCLDYWNSKIPTPDLTQSAP